MADSAVLGVTITMTCAATLTWLAGMRALLAAWLWCGDPAHVGDVPALVGRLAGRFGHGGFDDTSGLWQIEGCGR